MEHEARREGRRVLKSATLRFGWSGSINCIVRNLSNNGAAVDVESSLGIPDKVTLHIPADNMHQPAQIVWRKSQQIGLEFDFSAASDGPAGEAA